MHAGKGPRWDGRKTDPLRPCALDKFAAEARELGMNPGRSTPPCTMPPSRTRHRFAIFCPDPLPRTLAGNSIPRAKEEWPPALFRSRSDLTAECLNRNRAALGQTRLGLRSNRGTDQARTRQSDNSGKICHLLRQETHAIFAGAQGVGRLPVPWRESVTGSPHRAPDRPTVLRAARQRIPGWQGAEHC